MIYILYSVFFVLINVNTIFSKDFVAGTIVGNVEILKSGNSEWQEINEGDIIPENSEIRVNGKNDYIEIIYQGSSIIKLYGLTSIKVEEINKLYNNQNSSLLNLLTGKIFANIKISQNQTFRIKTTTAVAAVRGTKFGVSFQPSKGGKLIVTEGSVEVSDVFGIYSPILVNQGNKVLLPFSSDSPISEPQYINYSDLEEFGETETQKIIETKPEKEIVQPKEDKKDQVDLKQKTEQPKQIDKEVPKTETKTENKSVQEKPTQKQSETVSITQPKTTQPDTSSKKNEGEKKSEEKSKSESFTFGDFKIGVGFDNQNIDNKNWTRIRLFPYIPFWKFVFAFDIELFIDNKGEISSKGWNFSTIDATLDTILRKIYFISFSSRKNVLESDDIFSLRVGALENITLGNGIALNNYANTLNYPIDKKLGIELAVGNITPLKLGLEVIVNDFTEIVKGGGVVGSRFSLRPFGFINVPIINKLQIGCFLVADINQYSGIKDSDGDGYPDFVDKFPYNPLYYVDTDSDGYPDSEDLDLDGDGILDYNNLTQTQKTNLDNFLNTLGYTNYVDFEVVSENVFSLSNKRDFFGIWGFDINIPVLNFLSFYFQYAMNLDINEENDTNMLIGWGISGPGIKLDFMPIISFNLEYRLKRDNFVFQYFNSQYDNERAILDITGKNVITKDNTIVNLRNSSGIFGNLIVNLFVLYGGFSLEYLIPENSTNIITDLNANIEGKLFANTNVIKNIPYVKDYIDDIELYYVHNNITNLERFFTINPNMYFGAKLKLNLGGNSKLVYYFERRFKYDLLNNIIEDDRMGISTETSF